MCRIFGYFGERSISDRVLERVQLAQRNGGPDHQTLKRGETWAVGNNRLAIQGLSGGEQPFNKGKIWAVYNGEIYNHQALKNELNREGYTFDACDGSVIIPLYEKYGTRFVEYLNGMFAIAIIDCRTEKKLILANDTASIKTLYYSWDFSHDALYFSSELPSLLEFPIERRIRPEAVHEYLVGRSIWHQKTFFDGIQTLPPSSMLVKTAGQPAKVSQYKTRLGIDEIVPSNLDDASRRLDDLLSEEMGLMTQAEAPTCLVTSGGLDSSYMTALASRYLPDLTCFNVAYEGNWPADERHFAKEVVEYYKGKYEQVLIRESEFPDILSKTVDHLGQPNSAPHALSTYALFKSVSDAGFKVAITGEGADEFFGGYERFRRATFDSNPDWFSGYFDTLCATTASMRNFVYHSDYLTFLESRKSEVLNGARNKIEDNELAFNSRLKSLLNFDQLERFPSYILSRVDHLSMANSVEVRVPFCQPRIINYSRKAPDEFLLDASSVKKLVYGAARDKLPKSIIERPKQPFTLPIVAMMKPGFVLFDIMQSTLTSQVFGNRGLFNQASIMKLIKDQVRHESADTANMLWSVMVLELWFQKINY
ncbi:MAG: asparagine synthase (glutamine-hydrolyzing) [Gammaproteobacteria bacterium CG11_big_fil_rev_8_21_14_0_20_46_22]|nr:MAG: asparagine synthase (glutamine-hydrolyzing) [Gammaproteobacteria bacterium CG11_big_fil_rev_8_21_14_0_20_46_22]